MAADCKLPTKFLVGQVLPLVAGVPTIRLEYVSLAQELRYLFFAEEYILRRKNRLRGQHKVQFASVLSLVTEIRRV